MVKTFGLTHVAVAVIDVARASRFYQQLLGAIEVYRQPGFVQLQTPGTRDVLVLEETKDARVGQSAGIAHFGFRLQDPTDIDAAAREVTRAGGTVVSQGEFCPGEPYLFATDPDGYTIEIWYELPTPVDPKTKASTRTSKGAKTRASAPRTMSRTMAKRSR
jgi:catechol 2,3-dioxygenase-like lactoylglutathione lyase family enzyme